MYFNEGLFYFLAAYLPLTFYGVKTCFNLITIHFCCNSSETVVRELRFTFFAGDPRAAELRSEF
jgi:hypothetical protein